MRGQWTAHGLARELLGGPDLPLLTPGHEEGYESIAGDTPARIVSIVPNTDGHWYNGKYRDAKADEVGSQAIEIC